MIEELTPEQRAALDALKASRGRCPSAEALVEYGALAEGDRARHAAHDHVQLCSRCQLVLLHAAEPAAAPAAASLKWLLPLAAILVLGVAVTMVPRNGGESAGPPADRTASVRGSQLQPMSPAGATELLREFAWQSPIVADRYRVIVRRGTAVVWQTETTAMRVAPPAAGTIERDVQYEWRVEALDREGNVRMTSPPQSFVVF